MNCSIHRNSIQDSNVHVKNSSKPKRCNFSSPVLLFVYFYWLSCPHLFVSRSDIVPTRHCLRSWEKPGMKKQLTFPLNVLGLRLSPAGVAGRSPASCLPPSRHPPGHAGSQRQGGGKTARDPPRWQALKPSSWTGAPTQKWACGEEWGWSEVVPAGRAGSRRLRAVSSEKDTAGALLTLAQTEPVSSRR